MFPCLVVQLNACHDSKLFLPFHLPEAWLDGMYSAWKLAGRVNRFRWGNTICSEIATSADMDWKKCDSMWRFTSHLRDHSYYLFNFTMFWPKLEELRSAGSETQIIPASFRTSMNTSEINSKGFGEQWSDITFSVQIKQCIASLFVRSISLPWKRTSSSCFGI